MHTATATAIPAARPTQRYVYVRTFGCQMNIYDSERMVQVLRGAGYAPTDDPAAADLILLNTCSVRAKPEHKVLSALGEYAKLKEYNDELVIGVGGCVATQEGERLLQRVASLDIVFGPDNIAELPRLVDAARQRRERVARTEFLDRKRYEWIPVEPTGGQVSAMLTVMKGCNKFCSFCIVPHTRGREVSKPPELVVEEARCLVAAGVREITLLGQNVNSWGRDLNRGRGPRFADLLEMVAQVDGLARLRFTTSHPWDASEALMRCFDGHLPALCEYLHLPVQSGDDTVLARMRRGYTAARFVEIVEALRSHCPDIALSTDVIVGFPGETDAQFERTVELLRRVRFDRIYAFAYSQRPGTVAARLDDDVPEQVKAERLHRVLEVQAAITAEIMRRRFEGKTVEVLVEGSSRKGMRRMDDGTWLPEMTGRTRTNFPVNFALPPGHGDVRGRLVRVRVERVGAHSVTGRLVWVEGQAAGGDGATAPVGQRSSTQEEVSPCTSR